MTDHDTDTARVDAHRSLHNIGLPPHPDVESQRRYWDAALPPQLALVVAQRDEAVAHLHALLNSRRTATQAMESDRAAREWLESIGSEAP